MEKAYNNRTIQRILETQTAGGWKSILKTKYHFILTLFLCLSSGPIVSHCLPAAWSSTAGLLLYVESVSPK